MTDLYCTRQFEGKSDLPIFGGGNHKWRFEGKSDLAIWEGVNSTWWFEGKSDEYNLPPPPAPPQLPTQIYPQIGKYDLPPPRNYNFWALFLTLNIMLYFTKVFYTKDQQATVNQFQAVTWADMERQQSIGFIFL